MGNKRQKLELVAPAGGPAQLIAAINAGADSVYLGYKQYGARAYAGNFSFRQLKWAVERAHDSGKKIYLTLNTIIKNSELSGLLGFLNKYISLCRDGIIIQDMGLLKVLKDLYPDVPVHASTQINIHNSRSLCFMARGGIKRAVLAREMSLDGIRAFYRPDGVDLEVFGHGSQCYSYSGICYFSSFTGGRSGNRGRCTQPCRMRYELIGTEDKRFKKISHKPLYLLSKSDLNTLDILPLIIEAGIDALKIEGRMKTPEYVAIIVKIYRKYIDLFYSDPGKYRIKEEDIYKINQMFSRRMGTGYYLGGEEKIVDPDRSGSIGNLIGRIKKVVMEVNGRKPFIDINSKWPIREGDILEVWTKKGKKRIEIDNAERIEAGSQAGYRIPVDDAGQYSPKDRVFKYFDKKVDGEAKSLYIYDSLAIKKDKNTISGVHDAEKLKSYMAEYVLEEGKKDCSREREHRNVTLTVRVYNKDGLYAAMENGAHGIIICPDSSPVKNGFAGDSGLNELIRYRSDRKKIIIDTPAMIYDSDMKGLQYTLESLRETGLEDIRISNLGILDYIRDYNENSCTGKQWYIRIGYNLNISNSLSASLYDGSVGNITGWEFSPELECSEIEDLIISFRGEEKEEILFSVFGHGYLRVAAARHSLFGETGTEKPGMKMFLQDPKKYRFPVVDDGRGCTSIYNSNNICSLFDLDSIFNSGVNDILIDSIFYSVPEIKEITSTYRKAVSLLSSGSTAGYAHYIKKYVNTPLFSNYSRGHLFRGVE